MCNVRSVLFVCVSVKEGKLNTGNLITRPREETVDTGTNWNSKDIDL